MKIFCIKYGTLLLHNGSQYASLPVGNSVNLVERYENFALTIDKIEYQNHKFSSFFMLV